MGADRISQGPAIDAVNHYDTQALVLDVNNNINETSGTNRIMAADRTCLFMPSSAQTALTNVTTAQNLINKTINAGCLNKIARGLMIKGALIFTTPGTTTPTLTIAVNLGAVSLISITTAATTATASANMQLGFEFMVMTASTGATGTMESHGRVDANISAGTPAAAISSYYDTNVAVSSAVNLATALALTVTVAASSVISPVQLRWATVEVVF